MKTVNALTVAAAVAGALSLAAVTAATPAMAAKTKCYGIAKAGQNDCGNTAGTHSCAGQSKVDYSGDDWKGVASAAACTEMGGQTKPFKGMNPKKKSS
ncbi:MAG: DUF2282 domain-containing protein [Rhodospirillaceae bacterium]|nr:DUF2282 domain-containing protein [Rhodospirillaceae bacterium]